ncbi:kinase-like domain-containing protein [Mycena belliarum]|uniref:Kinase-like domain-containing protein n=1 Tax=Mycena belliarum TaxID=1033014 RepID=A0AAD6U5P2_9AGAR|nr:kinase-like domain-containing protein [Mycena belliae]
MASGVPDPDDSSLYEREANLPGFEDRHMMREGRLGPSELFWRDHYSWLKDSGYLLRPRYSPRWSAPWMGTNKPSMNFEESVLPLSGIVMDATRTSDGSYVVLKRVHRPRPSATSGAPREAQMFQKFATEPLASDPKNHCIRLTEHLQVPDNEDTDLIVMPLLFRWNQYPFLTIGEALDFLSQVFEGLQFMHNHNIWHGDCKVNNVMMDASPLLKEDPHPWSANMTRDFRRRLSRVRNRTQNPVKYYWIDFDLSDEHDPSTGPALVDPCYGGIHHVPEFAFPDKKCDPFAVDIWCLGFMVQAYFTEGYKSFGLTKKQGFEFLDGLVADMVQEDPTKRPTIDDVVRRFSDIKAGLSKWKLRSRCTDTPPSRSVFNLLRSTVFWTRQLYLVARHIPPIPRH